MTLRKYIIADKFSMNQHDYAVSHPPVIFGVAAQTREPCPSPDGPAFSFSTADQRPFSTFLPVRFTGKGRELLCLHLRNIFFSLLTLGVYSFWGKVRIRRYLWEHTLILDESLEYTGTGGELFRSFFIVMLLLASMGGLYYALDALVSPYLAPFAAGILAVPLTHLGVYLALRYRLTRTRWRGIRGNLTGSSIVYALFASAFSLLSFITGSLLFPLQKAHLARRRANAAFFGNRPFRFTGTSGPLYGAFFRCLIQAALAGIFLSLLVYSGLYAASALLWPDSFAALWEALPEGKYSLWTIWGPLLTVLLAAWCFFTLYKAAQVRWFFTNLHFGRVAFSASRFTGWRFWRLLLGNLTLTVLTCGLGAPWATIRLYRFAAETLDASGAPDLENLLQNTGVAWSGGEGILDALNVDLSL